MTGVEIDGGATQQPDRDQRRRRQRRGRAEPDLSGNLFAGVWINGQGTDGNAVAGNFIGTSVTGDVALDNGTAAGLPTHSRLLTRRRSGDRRRRLRQPDRHRRQERR